MNKTITVQINFFGPYVKKNEIPKILNSKLERTICAFKRDLLERFFELPSSALSPEILERYIEVTTRDLHISIAPYTEVISGRLLKPLKAAKKHYCLGDYSSTIACCGIVAEMLTILLWKIHETRLQGQAITETHEKGLFGRKFEKLEQERRLKVLRTFGYTNNVQHDMFMAIKNNRNEYLHLWSVDLKNQRNDSLDTFKKAFRLFKEITGIGITDASTVRVNPLLIKLFSNTGEKIEKTGDT